MKKLIAILAIVIFLLAGTSLAIILLHPPRGTCGPEPILDPAEIYGDRNFDSVSALLESYTTELDEILDTRSAQLSDTASPDRIYALKYAAEVFKLNEKYSYWITKFDYNSVNQTIEETGFDKTDRWLAHLKKEKEFEADIEDFLAENSAKASEKTNNR